MDILLQVNSVLKPIGYNILTEYIYYIYIPQTITFYSLSLY